MSLEINPITGKLDKTRSNAEIIVVGNALYLRLDCSNDPLTGELVITPASGDNALKANKNITLKAGQRLVFDGD